MLLIIVCLPIYLIKFNCLVAIAEELFFCSSEIRPTTVLRPHISTPLPPFLSFFRSPAATYKREAAPSQTELLMQQAQPQGPGRQAQRGVEEEKEKDIPSAYEDSLTIFDLEICVILITHTAVCGREVAVSILKLDTHALLISPRCHCAHTVLVEFSDEEGFGRFLDMLECHQLFLNLKNGVVSV